MQSQGVEEVDDARKFLLVVTKYCRIPKPKKWNIYLSSFSPLQLCFILSLLSGINSWVTLEVISYRLGKSIGCSNWSSLTFTGGVSMSYVLACWGRMSGKGEWLSMADIEKYILSVMQNASKVLRQQQMETGWGSISPLGCWRGRSSVKSGKMNKRS